MVLRKLKRVLKRFIPATIYRPVLSRVRRIIASRRPPKPVNPINWGELRRRAPFSYNWGWDRGLPVDRYYVEAFLDRQRGDIFGHVLESGDATYTHLFGGERVTRADVLDPDPGNTRATIIGDLETGTGIPSDTFDCIIMTQVLPVIYDVKAAVANCFRALKPGGVLLVTVPSVARTTLEDKDYWGDYWRFTSQSARRMFAEVFPAGGVRVEAKGNMLTGVAFLYGLATPDLTPQELDYNDPCYEFVVTVRAVKPKGG